MVENIFTQLSCGLIGWGWLHQYGKWMIKKSFYDRLSVTSPVDENRLPKSQLKDIQAAVINQKVSM